MKRIRAIAFFVALPFFFANFSANAQNRSLTTEGTDFWFGFMPNYTIPAQHIYVYICSVGRSTVIISSYGGGTGDPVQSQKVTLAPGEAQTIELDVAKVETRVNETPAYRAVHVSSTGPIACYGFSNLYASSDGFLAIPTHGLGTKYYTANYFDDWYSSPSEPLAGEFLVVAPYDSTTVTIITTSDTRTDPTGLVIGHSKGSTWSVLLRKGQTYLVQSPGRDKSNDISGSLVLSDKPVGLLSGHQRCSIPNDPIDDPGNSKNHIIEMIPPVDEWSNDAYVLPMVGRTLCGNYVRIYSATDGNDIKVDGGQDLFLNSGEFAERTYVLSPEHYHSTGKMLTMMYAYSQGVHGDPFNADPFMLTISPQAQWSRAVNFRTPSNRNSNGDYAHYAVFTGPFDSLLGIQLNDKPLSAWGAVNPSSYLASANPKMGSVTVRPRASEILLRARSGAPFSVYLYGFTAVDGYGWPAAMGVMKQVSDSAAPVVQESGSTCRLRSVYVSDLGSGIAAISSIVDSLDVRGGRAGSNMLLTVDASFKTGDQSTHYTVRPINPGQPGFLNVFIVDRAGNSVMESYSYQNDPGNIRPNDTSISLSLSPYVDSCRRVTFTNKSADSVTIDSVSLNHPGPNFTLSTYRVRYPRRVAPGDSVSFQICIDSSDIGLLTDSVIIWQGCASNATGVFVSTQTGLLVTNDIGFGIVNIGTTKCAALSLRNVGGGTLTVLSQDLPASDAEISIDTAVKFPIVLQPGSSMDVNYCFHPTHTQTLSRLVRFTTANVGKYLHKNRDTTFLTGYAPTLSVGASTIRSGGISLEDLSPNPTSGSLVLRYSLGHEMKIAAKVYDESGKLLVTIHLPIESTPGTHTLAFDCSSLMNGKYFISLESSGFIASKKFVLER